MDGILGRDTGKELRDRRVALRLTQEQLAAELSVDRNTVARWERGERAIPPYLRLALETIEKKSAAKKRKTKPVQ